MDQSNLKEKTGCMEPPQETARTFDAQNSLPCLPIPGLNETCEKFLKWMEPLLSPSEYDETRKAVDDFTKNDGPVLHKALVEWSCQDNVCNWLEPLWFSHYLKDRLPVVINSNIFFMLKDKFQGRPVSQAQRSADIIDAVLRFHEMILQENLPCDMEKGCPLCMSQFSRILSTTRIPAKGGDLLRTPCSPDDPTPVKPDSIIVLFRGHFFSIRVLDGSEYVSSPEKIRKTLEKILSSDVPCLSDENCIGALTSLERDRWAEAREMLIHADEKNLSLLREIENSLCVLCLEDSEPGSRDEAARVMLHGDARNRWYDKSIEFIVCRDGTAGINYEHSSIDGSSVVNLTGFIFDHVPVQVGTEEDSLPFRELKFTLSPSIKEKISQACHDFGELADDTVVRVLDFVHFGKDRIKTFGLSPDGFVQMGIQLAYFRLRGVPCNTYEPVATRRFLHGRTEAMRSVTLESVEFTRKMAAPEVTDEEKAEALRAAVRRHVAGMKECKQGMGVDRYFLGLKKMYFQSGEELGVIGLPSIFQSPGYLKLCHNTISTSTSGHSGLDLCGFGPVVEDGFGVRYLTKADEINFNLSSRMVMKKDLEQFRSLLEKAYLEMADLMERVAR